MAVQGNYAFEMFETRGSAAPVRREVERPIEQPAQKQLRRVPDKSKKRVALERRLGVLRAFVIVLFAAVSLTLLCCQISVGAKSNELQRQIDNAEADLQEKKSENVRLNSALNGITTIDKICTYATDVLGMTKAERYQVECIDLSNGDVILFADGSSTGNADASQELPTVPLKPPAEPQD